MKKITLSLLCLVFICSPAVPQTQPSYESTDIVSVAKTAEILKKLAHLSLDWLMEWEGRLYIVAGPGDLARIEQANVPCRVETAKFYPHHSPLAAQGGINGDYHSYYELETDLKALESAFPALAKVQAIGRTPEGRNIYALKVSANVNLDEPESRVLFVGCHHAREWISVELPFSLGKYLLENYAQKSEIKALLDRSEIWLVPMVNPDGLEYTIHVYRYWRKNRRANSDGSYGVDPNRNYGYQWGYDNEGSSPEPSSEVYRGPFAFSEPETLAIRDLMLVKDFQAVVSYHSFAQDILYPWGYTTQPTAQDASLRAIAARMSELIRAVNGRSYTFGRAAESLYLTNGDLTDWAFGTFGIPAFTIELPPVDEIHGGFFNAEADISTIFQENLPAMLFLIERSIQDFRFLQEESRTDARRQDLRLRGKPQEKR